ncbi:NmrA/HSCARG family protein [Saccharopolyspora sp. WRP15-2]|uniref:NmrA/HSCARG family protein n=1 Tax=Saccharopolyspora oryzae TaxID=2997343 RepID=A0ABT4VAJ5_9PSEU|nr:NmrA/HSCARG family protein [Saccharopolyspora oryzae]MDA3630986.1 NmrA/HSCARG family protein [Saccharopolyspora oryzae]
MSTGDRVVLVVGATGQQGGATAVQLLNRGWQVRAFTRSAANAAARRLADMGAEVVEGDMGDRASLESAMRGVHGVFSVQPTFVSPELTPGMSHEVEVRWGKNVADAAKAAGVRHLVYASGFNADQASGVPTLENKWAVEQHIREIGVPATMLRPASFMENYLGMLPGQSVENGELVSALRADVAQPLIALADIGTFAALAFENPDEHIGGALQIAGDALTPPQITAGLSRAMGRELRHVEMPLEPLREQNPVLYHAYKALNALDLTAVDIPALREIHPGLLTFDSWLAKQDFAG